MYVFHSIMQPFNYSNVINWFWLVQVRNVVNQEVLKREVVEGEKVDEAKKKISKALNKLSKSKTTKQSIAIDKNDAAEATEVIEQVIE
ncbi:MAG: hypothetical protein COZ80_01130 [Ignavibacteria bacterium CG_4_8_14_3_um_filter_37_9]|nr:MAG: hypothetical protein COZ80_01130 [Ignavibacteria bacterium CG_4_8_14_3_um_filter_37_9]